MAEAIGLGASIVGIASAGISVVTALTIFGISFRKSRGKIDHLAGRVSLTATVLYAAAETIQENASGFKQAEFWKTWDKVLASCEETYDILAKAVKKARGSGASSAMVREKGSASTWRRLVWALGGELQMKDLELNLERQQLSAAEVEEQRELMSKLQALLTTLSKAGILTPSSEATSTTAIVIDDKISHTSTSDSIPDYSEGEESNDFSTRPNYYENRGYEYSANEKPNLSKTLDRGSFSTADIPSQTPPIPSPPDRPSVSFESRDDFFEAYYIIPRSISRTPPRGELQIVKPNSDEYMIIAVDHRKDHRRDQNVRQALRRAKDSGTSPDINLCPRRVKDATKWLANHRNDHSSQEEWVLVVCIELKYTDGSLFKSSSKSGFLVVLRGRRDSRRSCLPPRAKHGHSHKHGSNIQRHERRVEGEIIAGHELRRSSTEVIIEPEYKLPKRHRRYHSSPNRRRQQQLAQDYDSLPSSTGNVTSIAPPPISPPSILLGTDNPQNPARRKARPAIVSMGMAGRHITSSRGYVERKEIPDYRMSRPSPQNYIPTHTPPHMPLPDNDLSSTNDSSYYTTNTAPDLMEYNTAPGEILYNSSSPQQLSPRSIHAPNLCPSTPHDLPNTRCGRGKPGHLPSESDGSMYSDNDTIRNFGPTARMPSVGSYSDAEDSVSEALGIETGDEGSGVGKSTEKDEIHLSQQEAELMMMKFLATFATLG
ncbi:hypothetical protein B7494_g6247 [Chlorociboria aeruginascens]|nr:hypothetical protein B7494_g6247 [Chlorociboria aeruginascens]